MSGHEECESAFKEIEAENAKLRAEVEQLHKENLIAWNNWGKELEQTKLQVRDYKAALERIAGEDQALHDVDPDCEYKKNDDCCNCTSRLATKALGIDKPRCATCEFPAGHTELCCSCDRCSKKRSCTCPEVKLHQGESAICPACADKRVEGS